MACDNLVMRALLIPVAAVLVGLAGGYAWSSMGAGPTKPRPPTARFMALPASPEEEPAPLDEQWAERAAAGPAAAAATPSASTDQAPFGNADQATVYYSGCNEVRAAGKAPLHAGDPGYRTDMDGDGDGLACEPIRH